ncbi:hypothetical protein DB347_20150 [Opitutaceae bacterium EW11]|nr:hypothetical protein DB347_20150 [Opitutaceae bacterium EW11]
MKRLRVIPTLATALLLPLLASCTEKPPAHDRAEAGDHEHGEAAHDETEVAFEEGRGLRLPVATASALGIRTAQVEERILAPRLTVAASVFETGSTARALALVPAELADEIERCRPERAELISVRRDVASALKQVEIVFALEGAAAVGDSVQVVLRGPERRVRALPRSAVHRTATGAFVYVATGEWWQRRELTLGAADDSYVEIVKGPAVGEAVASAGVEQLWLTELRFTKGGGHSH